MKYRFAIFFFILSIITGLLLGALSNDVLEHIVSFGHFLPRHDILADYFTAWTCAILITVFLLYTYLEPAEKKALLILWGIRCAITLIAMLYYEDHYGLDAYYYFEKGRLNLFDFHQMRFGDGTSMMIGLSWIIMHSLFLENSYHGLKVIFSGFGMIAIYCFYLGCSEVLGKRDVKNLYFIALFPSVLFWSSILGKDPLNLMGISIYFLGGSLWYSRKKTGYLLLSLLGIGIAGMVRTWYVGILMIPFAYFVFRNRNSIPPQQRIQFITMAVVISIVMWIGLKTTFDQFHATSLDSTISSTNAISKSWKKGGSAADEIPVFNSVSSMLTFLPYGMFTAVFRPLPGEVLNPFGLLAGLENLYLLYLICLHFYRSGLRRILRQRFYFWIISVVLLWSMLYAFISPQNLGSAFRFKLQILPFLLVLIIALRSQEDKKCVV